MYENLSKTYHATYSEMELVGAIFLKPKKVLNEIRKIISPSDFSNDQAKAIYLAACELFDAGQTVDYGPVQSKASEMGMNISNEYLVDVLNFTATAANAKINAEGMHKAALARKAKDLGTQLAEGELDATEMLDKLKDIISDNKKEITDPIDDCEAFMTYWDNATSGLLKPFVTTGYNNVDEMLGGGFIDSSLNILAARPAMGKTAVGLAIADNIAGQGKTILYESLEMSKTQLWARRVARLSRYSASDMLRGSPRTLEKSAVDAIENSAILLGKRKFYIAAHSATVEDIEQDMRSVDNLSLLVIDHIGLIKNPTGASRYEFMSNVTHRLKQLAISTGIPILALCQLNRTTVMDGKTRPTMAQLRDAGTIEENADTVMLLHRPDYYADKEDRPPSWAPQDMEIIVDKNRHGSTGICNLLFTPAYMDVVEKNSGGEQ